MLNQISLFEQEELNDGAKERIHPVTDGLPDGYISKGEVYENVELWRVLEFTLLTKKIKRAVKIGTCKIHGFIFNGDYYRVDVHVGVPGANVERFIVDSKFWNQGMSSGILYIA